MSIPMSREEIWLTLSKLEENNNMVHEAHYDRVIERVCAYMNANIDDFMECYEDDDK